MSHPSTERSNNSGIHPKPSLSTQGSALSKGKSTSPSPRHALQGGVRPTSLVTHSRSPTPTSKPSPHGTGNPSTSRLSSPASQTRPEVRDSESDDDAPLVFRARAKPVPSLKVQSKDHFKNGVISSRVDADTARKVVETVRKATGNACHQSLEHPADNSEDDRPLAGRLPAKRPPEVLAQARGAGADDSDGDDEDDDKPLVLKRRTNGPGPAKMAKSHATPQTEDGSSKKRPLANSDDDDDKPLAWRRGSDGPTKSQAVQKEDLSSKKRPPDEIKKHDAEGKKLKLSGAVPKSSGMSLAKPQVHASKPSMTPKTPTSSFKSSTLSTKLPTPATKPHSAPPKPLTQGLKPSATPTKPLTAPAKPSTETSKPMGTPPKPLTAPTRPSTEPSRPVIASPKLSATSSHSSVKVEVDEDEDDVPLAQRISGPKVVKTADERIPLAERIAASKASKKAIIIKKTLTTSVAAKKLVEAKKAKLKQQQKLMSGRSVKGDKNAPGAGGGKKWTTLEHNGVIFPPPYSPHGVKMQYEKKPVTLTPEQEEVATMFAVMRDTDYATKPKFLSNFWNDWKKLLGSNHVIKNLDGCDFTPIYDWALAEKEKKKHLPAEEKKRIKEEKAKQEDKYMWALVDGVKEKVGNFRVEPPGLFRGRGEHPKMGKLKRRIFPEDIVINIGRDASIPECPMPGHRWKEIRNDDTVTWLAYWNDPINTKEFKYVFLAASSSLKGQSDREKYEKARTLKDYIEDIRKTYTRNFTSNDMTQKQIAVATYLIDRLALRAGNEKDDDEADTVGCCSLKVEHVTLVPPKSLQFDFLGKDSIRYFNTVEVVEPVYKAIGDFKKSKKSGQDLFDKLDTSKLNAHLKNIMPHLTAKVFRTYNASITLDRLLVHTDGQIVAEKIASYQKANKEVAILCNHQRSVSKTHGAQMERLEGKMTELEDLLKELQVDLDRAKRGKPPLKDADGKPKRNQNPEALEKKIMQTEQKIEKMRLDMQIKDDLKTVALGTSKINYMDPRITVAWCKRHEVPIEKVFNKSLLAKFAWAMDVEMEYCF